MKKIASLFFSIIATSILADAQNMKFDFGPQGAVAEGYVGVSASDIYSDQSGYGFEPGVAISEFANKKGTDLTKDYVTSDEVFKFSVKLPEGNYKVTLTLGDTKGTSCTTVKSEIRRLHLESFKTAKSEVREVSFNVNIRTPKLSKNNEIKLNGSEMDYATGAIKKLTWDDKLTLAFYDAEPKLCALSIEPASEKVITVFVIGDSTVTDQAGGGTWGQYLPRWFDGNVVVANHAESGMTIKGFRFGRRWDKIMESCKEGDYLLIQLGTNDEKSRGHDPMWDSEDMAGDWIRTHSAADSDYIWELAAMAVEARRHGVTPVIVSPMTKINRADGTATTLMTPYGVNAPKAAELAGCAFIDLWGMSMDIVKALGKDSVKAYSDGTHTDNYGAYLFSLGIVKGIRENGLGLAQFVLPDTPDFNPKDPHPSLAEFTCPIEPRRPSAKPAPKQTENANGMTQFGPL